MDMKIEDAKIKIDIAQALKGIRAIIFHINAIKASDDKEEIKVYIECLQEAANSMPRDWHTNSTEKERIREGIGDYAKISQKCIDLGVV